MNPGNLAPKPNVLKPGGVSTHQAAKRHWSISNCQHNPPFKISSTDHLKAGICQDEFQILFQKWSLSTSLHVLCPDGLRGSTNYGDLI